MNKILCVHWYSYEVICCSALFSVVICRLKLASLFLFFQGAAVAYVADMFSTPAIFVKAVTDIVDGEKPTAEEFLQNLVAVTAALDKAVTEVVDFISGKCISDL